MKDFCEWAFSDGWRYWGITLWVLILACGISDMGKTIVSTEKGRKGA